MTEYQHATTPVSWIWKKEQLIKILHKKNHQLDEVEWAIHVLNLQCPEDAIQEAVHLLQTRDKEVADFAAQFLVQFRELSDIEPLKSYYQNNKGDVPLPVNEFLFLRDPEGFVRLFDQISLENCTDNNLQYFVILAGFSFYQNSHGQGLLKKVGEQLLTDLEAKKDVSEYRKSAIVTALMVSGPVMLDLFRRCLAHPGMADFFPRIVEIFSHTNGYNSSDSHHDHECLCDGSGHQKNCGDDCQCQHEECDCQGSDELSTLTENFNALREIGDSKQIIKWEKAFKKKDFPTLVASVLEELRSWLAAQKKHCGEDNFSAWEQQAISTIRLINMIESLGQSLELVPDPHKEQWTLLILNVFEKLQRVREFIGFPLNQFDLPVLLDYYFQDREELVMAPSIENFLAHISDKSPIIDACYHTLETRFDSPAAYRAAAYLVSLGIIEHVRRVLSLIHGDDNFLEQVMEHIQLDAVDKVTLGREILANESEKDLTAIGLFLLETTPCEESVQILLNHWDELWCFDKDLIMNCIEGIGDQRFIRPLKNEWREGELREGYILLFLFQINGVRDNISKKISTDIKYWDKFFRRSEGFVENMDYKSLIINPIPAVGTCLQCKRKYNYLLHQLHVIDDPLEILIQDKIKCKNCGTYDSFYFDESLEENVTHYMATMMKMRLNLGEEAPKENWEDSTVKWTKGFSVEGKPATSDQMIEHYTHLISEEPENGKQWFELGSLLLSKKRSMEAIDCWKKSLEIEPVAIDPQLALALFYVESEDYERAYQFYNDVYLIIDVGVYWGDEVTPQNAREIIAPGFVEAAVHIRKNLPEDIIQTYQMIMENQ